MARMSRTHVASYMLALIMLVFGVVGLLYAGKPLREGRTHEGIPLAAGAAAALVIGYLELRLFIINVLIEEEETLLEEEMTRLKHIEDVEVHIETVEAHIEDEESRIEGMLTRGGKPSGPPAKVARESRDAKA